MTPREWTLARENGTIVCERCVVAESLLSRSKGLLGRRELAPGEGLLLRPASSIHMFFMRFPIDVVFLDRNLVVRKIVPRLKPWRLGFRLGSETVLEMPPSACERRGLPTRDPVVPAQPATPRPGSPRLGLRPPAP